MKTFWGRLEDVLKTSFQDVLKTFWKRLQSVLARCLEDVLKTFLQDVLKTFWQNALNTSSKRLEKVLKMSWRRMTKTDIFVLMKTFSRYLQGIFWRRMTRWIYWFWSKRLQDIFKMFSEDEDEKFLTDQDECLLSYITHHTLWVFAV